MNSGFGVKLRDHGGLQRTNGCVSAAYPSTLGSNHNPAKNIRTKFDIDRRTSNKKTQAHKPLTKKTQCSVESFFGVFSKEKIFFLERRHQRFCFSKIAEVMKCHG